MVLDFHCVVWRWIVCNRHDLDGGYQTESAQRRPHLRRIGGVAHRGGIRGRLNHHNLSIRIAVPPPFDHVAES